MGSSSPRFGVNIKNVFELPPPSSRSCFRFQEAQLKQVPWPLWSWMLLDLLMHFLEKNNWCIGKNGSKNSKMSHFCMILNFQPDSFSSLNMASSSPIFWGLQFQKTFGNHNLDERRNEISVELVQHFPWDDKNQSTSAISYHLSSRCFVFKKPKTQQLFPCSNHQKPNSKKKPLNKKPNPQLIMAISIYLKVLGVFSVVASQNKNTIQPR